MPDFSEAARIVRTLDGSNTLADPRSGELLRSRNGAASESYHVFLRATGVLERFEQRRSTRVLEIGFGTGLSALLTLDEAQRAQVALEFISVERDLVAAPLLRQLEHRTLLTHPDLADAVYAALERGERDIEPHPSTRLRLIEGDARSVELPERCDAVYLDPFSPEVNPDAWTPGFLARLRDALAPGGRLATYCAKGDVRRTLLALGFEVTKAPGPRGKRHMLIATR